MADPKNVLAQRLAHWLNRVLAAGRAKSGSASEPDEDDEDCIHDTARKQKQTLVEHSYQPGEVPAGAEVTAEQAESALGRTCLLYTSPSPRDLSTSRMPSSA